MRQQRDWISWLFGNARNRYMVPCTSYEESLQTPPQYRTLKVSVSTLECLSSPILSWKKLLTGKLRNGREVVDRLYELNFKRMEQFMNEIEILTRLRLQNLVTLYGCTSRRSRELLVYEYSSLCCYGHLMYDNM